MCDSPDSDVKQLEAARDQLDRLKEEINDAQYQYDNLLESEEEREASYQWFDIRDREYIECRLRGCERIKVQER